MPGRAGAAARSNGARRESERSCKHDEKVSTCDAYEAEMVSISPISKMGKIYRTLLLCALGASCAVPRVCAAEAGIGDMIADATRLRIAPAPP